MRHPVAPVKLDALQYESTSAPAKNLKSASQQKFRQFEPNEGTCNRTHAVASASTGPCVGVRVQSCGTKFKLIDGFGNSHHAGRVPIPSCS
jgi:hypothetical protein